MAEGDDAATAAAAPATAPPPVEARLPAEPGTHAVAPPTPLGPRWPQPHAEEEEEEEGVCDPAPAVGRAGLTAETGERAARTAGGGGGRSTAAAVVDAGGEGGAGNEVSS